MASGVSALAAGGLYFGAWTAKADFDEGTDRVDRAAALDRNAAFLYGTAGATGMSVAFLVGAVVGGQW